MIDGVRRDIVFSCISTGKAPMLSQILRSNSHEAHWSTKNLNEKGKDASTPGFGAGERLLQVEAGTSRGVQSG